MIKAISDEERREVAQKLREVETLEWDGNVWCDEWNVLNALGLYNEDDPNSCNPDKVAYLADLIDRPTCRNVYDETKMGACTNGFECSECGNRVEDLEHCCITGTFNCCPKCGREVVSNDD